MIPCWPSHDPEVFQQIRRHELVQSILDLLSTSSICQLKPILQSQVVSLEIDCYTGHTFAQQEDQFQGCISL